MIIVQGRATHHNMFIAFIDYINVSCRRIRSYNYLFALYPMDSTTLLFTSFDADGYTDL